ncbi:hypothetical protein EPUS_08791 [Endocarpon pusillum Z07020]|uniref:Retrovirus-related Pol polyprotein from transposon TNT 1-94-like beta-barrel domain-containing protein n=1 Tax=Endocarpon pusillum (strain Z07020 / HMAS-L-300199) TaxID=1263415 RepID=U1HRV3_ENDPU|nr:uncharacterized protein EPUS_08791 [Endocarpon pusillum Z07020]ERF73240.1 hypothetical protein EPUS_08791 [Endocarpon pusillum Z07020]
MSSTDNNDHEKREKLKGFENWPRWSNLAHLRLIEKELWKYIAPGPPNDPDNHRAARAAYILKRDVSDELFQGIEAINNPRLIWNHLKSVCSQAGQGVIYASLRELFSHPANYKPFGLEKSINARVSELSAIVKRIRTAVNPTRDIWEDIQIIQLLEGLPTQFDSKKEHILNQKDMKLADVQQILASEEVRINADLKTGLLSEVAMSVRFRSRQRKNLAEIQCYNYDELGHFARDCKLAKQTERSTNKRRNTTESKRPASKRCINQVKAKNGTDSDSKQQEFPHSVVYAVKSTKLNKERNWYIDSCASKHITGQSSWFQALTTTNERFTTANAGTIIAKQVGTVRIETEDGYVDINDVAYAPACTSNLLSLSQLKSNGVKYVDMDDYMALVVNEEIVACVTLKDNLFVLNSTHAAMLMAQLWHRRLGHASHVRVAQASRMSTGMDLATSDTDQAIFELDLAISGTELTEQQEDGQICEPCVKSKQTRMIHHKGGQKTTRKLELVHSDLWGPYYPASFRSKHYAIVLEDDFTKKSWIGFLIQKSDAYEYFKN